MSIRKESGYTAESEIKVHSSAGSISQFPQQKVSVGVFACACLYLTYFWKNTQETAPSGEWDGVSSGRENHASLYTPLHFLPHACVIFIIIIILKPQHLVS